MEVNTTAQRISLIPKYWPVICAWNLTLPFYAAYSLEITSVIQVWFRTSHVTENVSIQCKDCKGKGTVSRPPLPDQPTALCMLSRFSHVWLFVTPCTVARQAPAMSSSRGSSPTPGSNPRLLQLLHCRQILFCWATREAPNRHTAFCKTSQIIHTRKKHFAVYPLHAYIKKKLLPLCLLFAYLVTSL